MCLPAWEGPPETLDAVPCPQEPVSLWGMHPQTGRSPGSGYRAGAPKGGALGLQSQRAPGRAAEMAGSRDERARCLEGGGRPSPGRLSGGPEPPRRSGPIQPWL